VGRIESVASNLGSGLRQAILKEYDENYQCCGARKMWLELRSGRGIDVARCTVERLMKTPWPAGRSSRQEQTHDGPLPGRDQGPGPGQTQLQPIAAQQVVGR
jgi:hypothetical protein